MTGWKEQVGGWKEEVTEAYCESLGRMPDPGGMMSYLRAIKRKVTPSPMFRRDGIRRLHATLPHYTPSVMGPAPLSPAPLHGPIRPGPLRPEAPYDLLFTP